MGTTSSSSVSPSSSSVSPSSSSSRRFFGEEWTLLYRSIPGGCRCGFAYASLDGKRHFLCGGVGVGVLADGFSSTVLEYNSSSQNWRTHPPLPEARFDSAATAIDSDRFLVVGGHYGSLGAFSSSTAKSSCFVYDTRSEEWSTDWPLLNIGRFGHASVLTHNKKAYVIGGRNYYNDLDSIEEIDLSLPTPSWTVLPQGLKKKRTACRAIAHPKNPNYIIVVGGCNNNDQFLRCCEMVCLDQTEEGQTRTLPSMMTPRGGHTLVLVENRFVVAMGGCDGSQISSSVEYLDLEEPQEQQQWRPLPSMKTARTYSAAFYCSENHKIVVVGGVDGANMVLDTVEELPFLLQEHAHSSRQLREPPRQRDLPPGTIDPHGPPQDLLCPITLEVMVDPVMTADGHTYERAAIQRVFQNTAQGEDPRSPVTGLLLSSRLLIPNIALRRMCMDHSEQKGK